MSLKEIIEKKMLPMNGYYSENETFKDSLNEVRRECITDIKEAVLKFRKELLESKNGICNNTDIDLDKFDLIFGEWEE